MNITKPASTKDNLASDNEIVREFLDRAKIPAALGSQDQDSLITRIKNLLKAKNAKLVAHYYTDPSLQDLAEDTNGFVGDSLEMARFGKDTDAEI